jgi:DNA-binding IscR family transcriptional regulator
VEQQVSMLSRAGITDCRRGSSGGCRLARPADEVTVRDVIEALQGEVLDVPHQHDSATAEFWQQTASTLSGFTDSRTLAELVKRQSELDLQAEPIYYI